MNKLTGSLIVGYDLGEDGKTGVLVIGKQEKGKMKVLNAVKDQEALDLFNRLLSIKKEEKDA